MSLPVFSMGSESTRKRNRPDTAVFIKEHFNQRRRSSYPEIPQSHKERSPGDDSVSRQYSDHGISNIKCDTYGEISFTYYGSQSRNSPFIRLSDDSHMEEVFTLLTSDSLWQLPFPRLLISVTGGAKDCKMLPRLEEILKQGLVNAAVSTGAWIITGGTATGVMKLVGEAVHDYIQAFGNPEDNEIVALGIAAWGFVANNKVLEHAEKNEGPVIYSMLDAAKAQKRFPLDHNHTHFLLVDDGNTEDPGGEIKFRSELERFISKQKEIETDSHTAAVNVPTVLIVVEGGINTLKTVEESISRGTPVVVVAGSGRAADLISEATKRRGDSEFDKIMTVKAEELLNVKGKDARTALSHLKGIFSDKDEEKKNLLNIFNLDKADSWKDIEKEVISAIIKANNSKVDSQLSLALAWHRCDIARQKIFTSDNRTNWQKADLNGSMFKALVEDQGDFVQLFLDHGVDLKQFLTIRRLWDLYSDCVEYEGISELLKYSFYVKENQQQKQTDHTSSSQPSSSAKDQPSKLTSREAERTGPSDREAEDCKPEGKRRQKGKAPRKKQDRETHNINREEKLGKEEEEEKQGREEEARKRREKKHGRREEEKRKKRTATSTSKKSESRPSQHNEVYSDPSQSQNDPNLLLYISKVVVHLLKNESFGFYSDKRYRVTTGQNSEGSEPRLREQSTPGPQGSEGAIKDEPDFAHPERELFLWAILFNRWHLAKLFWKSGRDHLGGALCASALLKRLSARAEKKDMTELSSDLEKHSQHWELCAMSVLSECYSSDREMTYRLLVRELPHWSQQERPERPTLLNMAEAYKLMEFAGHSACQTKLSAIWRGRLAVYTPGWKIFFCIFFPLLLFITKFTEDPTKEHPHRQDKNRVSPQDLAQNGNRSVSSSRGRRSAAVKLRTVKLYSCCLGKDHISCWLALYYFYTAPVTKFLCNVIAFLIYLCLFSYFVLVELDEKTTTPLEYVTWIWLISMIIEEIRQMLFRDQLSIKYRIKNWISDLWNKFDVAMLCFFVASIGLRFLLPYFEKDFRWARAFYSVTLVLSFLRFLQFFYAVRSMGPKVIMIQKMMEDMMLFLAVLSVFVIGFGVAYHANMFPKAPPDWSILANVFYYPYFQIYGELFLENMKGEDVEGCENNETLWRTDPFNRCPEGNPVFMSLMLAVYLILTNVLLVNLLIAMFSYTFYKVQENSLKVWRFYRLSLVHEYFDRPAFVPPFIVFNHLFRLLRRICSDSSKKFNAFRWKIKKDEDRRLTLFEKKATERYLLPSATSANKTNDTGTVAAVEDLKLMINEIRQKIGMRESMDSHDPRNQKRCVEMGSQDSHDEMQDVKVTIFPDSPDQDGSNGENIARRIRSKKTTAFKNECPDSITTSEA